MTANNTYRLGLQLRRTLSLSSTILSQPRLTATTLRQTTLPNQQPSQPTTIFSASAPRNFHSSPHLSFSSRSFNDVDQIDPETVLFEGCDYKHWLIVIDFGKDPNQRPPPDQMVDFYVQTCAKVLGSVEEAKRRIYACSTTTYTGFQVEVDEDTSKKFETLPGVIFVLPDSFIDPVNKEYGGDKYINGDIIPRPPPVQYGRTGRTFQRPRVMPQQGNPPYNQHNSMPHETRSYTPQVPQQGFQHQQNSPPQQNYGPSGPTNRVASIPSGPHNPGVRDGYQGGQSDRVASMPSGLQNPGVGRDGYQGGQRNFVSPQHGSYSQDYRHPQGQMNNHPGNHAGYAPSGQYRNDSADYGNNHPQRQRGNVPEGHGGYAPPGQLGLSGGNRSNSPHSVTGGYEQTGHGSYEQSGNGQYGQGPHGSYDHGPRYAPHGESQRLPRTSNEQNNSMEHRNYPPGAQTGI